MSKVLEMVAHNVLGVKDVRLDMEGHHLYLVAGGNYQGKTSTLQALMMCIAGKSGMEGYPEVALRNGAKRGSVKTRIEGDPEIFGQDNSGTLVAELKWRRKASGEIDETFRLYDEESGEEAPTPRKLLQQMYKFKGFDPLAFARMKPIEQAKTVQDLLGVDLEAFDSKRQKIFEERRQIGVEGKKAKGHLDSLAKHDDVPDEETMVVDLLGELDGLKDRYEARRHLEQETERNVAKVDSLHKGIEQAEAEIKALKAKVSASKKEIKEIEATVKESEKKLEESPDFADPSEDIAAMNERIKNCEVVNAKVRENKAYANAAKEVKRLRDEYEAKTEAIQDLDEEKQKAVQEAEWPVEGMELTDDGLLLDGLPFAQASTSQRIMASVKVGMALNPSLRLLICEHGSDLDNEMLAEIEKIAKENDFQILLELVTRTDADAERCQVVIRDGRVQGADESEDE